MIRFRQLIAATYTAYDNSGDINTNPIPVYANHLKRSGATGVFVNGTTGEGLSLTIDERKTLAESWVKEKGDNFRVLIHVGHNSIREAQVLAKHAAEIKADGIGAMGPTFLKPKHLRELINFNESIASSAPDLPYYYYHIPSMTGIQFQMIDFLEQAAGRLPNLEGIKFTGSDLMDMKSCVNFQDGKYRILHGRDEILLSGLVLGVTGAIGSTYNYLAPLFQQLISAFKSGNLTEADLWQSKAINIIRILLKYGGGISGGKAIMGLIGLKFGQPRLPVSAVSPEQIKNLRHELDALGFFELLTDLPINA